MSPLSFIRAAWQDETRRQIVLIVVSAIALLLGFFDVTVSGIDLSWVAILLCGTPIVIEAAIGLITRFDVKADLLVSLALIASIIIGEYFAAGEIAVIMQLGALLEEMTVAKARKGIERLASLAPETARVVTSGTERIIPASEVKKGETIRVNPGETVPVDGEILSGSTSVDESVLTGEPMPVDKTAGDHVMSGSINRFGVFELRADAVGDASTIARMAKLVESADASRAKIVRLADRWATWIVAAALSMACVTWLVTGEEIRAVTILVVFCPCALVLATPTAVMAAIGCATKRGVLVREGDALERLAEIDRAAFDKTGTLTTGEPTLCGVKSLSKTCSENDILRFAAIAEKPSSHPLGRAIIRGLKDAEKAGLPNPDDFKMESGSGVSARIDDHAVAVGRLSWLKRIGAAGTGDARSAAAVFEAEGATTVFIALDGAVVGFIALSDAMRPGIANVMRSLEKQNVSPMLMTGDHKEAAEHIAKEAGIDERFVDAGCMPEDKLRRLESLERATIHTAMVGDGINDAPVLALSHVGIAMGGLGSDAAIETADVVIQTDQPSRVATAIHAGRQTRRIVWQNISLAFGVKLLVLILGAGGIATLWEAVFADVGVALIAIVNAIRIQKLIK